MFFLFLFFIFCFFIFNASVFPLHTIWRFHQSFCVAKTQNPWYCKKTYLQWETSLGTFDSCFLTISRILTTVLLPYQGFCVETNHQHYLGGYIIIIVIDILIVIIMLRQILRKRRISPNPETPWYLPPLAQAVNLSDGVTFHLILWTTVKIQELVWRRLIIYVNGIDNIGRIMS